MPLAALLVPLLAYSPPLIARRHAPVHCTASIETRADSGFAVVNSYDGAISLLLDEIASTQKGDAINLSLYLLEGGKSSERVLTALEEAGTRGVNVIFGLDVSYVSAISRLIEKTDTLIPRAEAMAATHPGWCACTYRSKPDHGKFATFTRCGDGAVSSAILGGINLGDRFVDWDDYAIRLPGASAEALATLCADEATGCDVDLASFAFSTDASVNSVAAAETIAYVSPVVALFTLLTTAAAFATLAFTSLALGLSQPVDGIALPGVQLTIVLAAIATTLGISFATSADGGPFDLIYELQMFVRSLVYDRSALGDVLSPLRFLYTDRRGIDLEQQQQPVESTASPIDTRLVPPITLPTSDESVRLVCNRRIQQRYEIEPTFRALFSDTSYTKYRVVMAYLGHRWGIELLEYALKRGAEVELLIPARPNVYANENLRAAQTLVDADWPNLSLYLHPEMVHAKATLARSSDKDLAFIGSANLVRGSLNLPVHCGLLPYDELNVLTSETSITSSLDASMETLFKEARLVGKGEQLLDASEWYSEPRACWEELWQ